MKKKSILILLGIFVALVLLAVLLENLGRRGEKKADEESIIFPGFAADEVSSIEIKTRDKEVRLNREGDTWLVATDGNYPADAEAIKAMLDKVKELKSALVASRSADKHSQFEVDAASGIGVTMLGAEGGKVLAHFLVGKMGSDYMSTYIRRADQDEVLLADGYLKSIFDKGARGWRDRTIFDFDAAQVQKLVLISQEKGKIALQAREDGGWQIIEPEIAPANKEPVDEIIGDLSKLSADDFAKEEEPAEQPDTGTKAQKALDPLAKYKLDNPQSKVIVNLKDGSARVLLIGDKLGQRHYVKREGKDTVFMLSSSKIDSIFKNLVDLKAEPGETSPAESKPG